MSLSAGGIDGIVQGLAVAEAAPAIVGDYGAVADRIVESIDGGTDTAAPRRVVELHRHQLHIPVHADDASAVVACRTEDARDMRAVVVVVEGIVVVVGEVPADDVIDIFIAVIGDAIGPAALAGPE